MTLKKIIILISSVAFLILQADSTTLDEEEEETPWHMTIGGYWTNEGPEWLTYSSVELFNWQTNEQCNIESLPLPGVVTPVAAFFNGTPTSCGGLRFDGVEFLDCFTLNSGTGKWDKISDLIYSASFTGSVVVPYEGWHIFGGSNLPNSQKLKSIDGNWEIGPGLYEFNSDSGHCSVQISDTVTAFLGGFNDPQGILTFDWETFAYTKHEARLLKERIESACALMMDQDEEPFVAIAGGFSPDSKGMEAWYPLNGTTVTLSDVLPLEDHSALQLSQLIPINGGQEALLYGGWAFHAYAENGIWKYSTVTGEWNQVGEMLAQRAAHVTIPVNGVQCS